MKLVGSQSGRSENGVSFLTYFRFPSSHTTVRAVRHTAVSCLSCPFWTPHIGHRHFFSIVGIRPIVLKREFLFGHLTTTVSKYTDCLVRQCTIRPFALTVTRSATSASADSSTFVVTILADCRGLAGKAIHLSSFTCMVYATRLRLPLGASLSLASLSAWCALVPCFCSSGHDFAIASSLPSVTTRNLQVAMGFVGNYAPYGLSPHMYDMPVIPK